MGLPFIFFVVVIVYSVSGQVSLPMKNYSRTLEMVMENSDPRIRPDFGGPPVKVGIMMYLLNTPSVDHEYRRFTCHMYMRQFWKDKRLSFVPKPGIEKITLNYAGEIWQPDTFLPNEQRSLFHSFSIPNAFYRITSEGDVLKSERVTIIASCPMNFKYFPLDMQVCSLEMESYGYSMKDVIYYWRSESRSVGVSNEDLDPEFTFIGHRLTTKEIQLSTGNYSRLVANFFLKRNYRFHLFNVYIPTVLVFFLAWLTLWINPKSIQARLVLSISALGLKVALLVAARIYSPAESYLNPLEIYMGISLLCVLGVVIHHAFVSHVLVQDEKETDLDTTGEKKKPFTILSMEKYIRFALLLLYVLFNFFYWIVLTQASSKYESDLMNSSIKLHEE